MVRNYLDSVFAFTYRSASAETDRGDFMQVNSLLLLFIMALLVIGTKLDTALAAEARRVGEWEKIVEAAKKEGKIVLAIPPAAELRKEMEGTIKRKLGLEAELVPNPGPKNASRIAAEQKAGVHYFDALIVGTGTAVSLAHDGMLEPIDPFLVLPEVKDPKQWWGGHIWEDNISTNRFLYSFLADVSTHGIWYNTSLVKPEDFRSFDDYGACPDRQSAW